MRAWELQNTFGLSNLRLITRIEKPLESRQVRVRVRACSLNYRDILVISGSYNKHQPMPLVPLSDGAGEVVEVANDVTSVKVGDKVCGTFAQNWAFGLPTKAIMRSTLGSPLDGMLQETIVLSEMGVVHFPDHLSFEEASTLPCAALTAFSSLVVETNLKPGQTVLLQGTGGVSIFGLQIAKVMGACVIITSSSHEKLKRAQALGANHLIHYPSVKDWAEEAKALTNNEGVDAILEVGGAGTLETSLKAVRMGGQINLIGVLAKPPKTLILTGALMNHIRIQGIFVGNRQDFLAMNRCISLNKIRPVIDRVFSFEKAPEALSYLQEGKHFGKVCIVMP